MKRVAICFWGQTRTDKGLEKCYKKQSDYRTNNLEQKNYKGFQGCLWRICILK